MYNSSFLAGFNSRQLLSTDFQTNSTKCNRCFPHDYNHSLQWRKAESVCGYSIKNHSANYHCYCSYKIAHKTNSNSNACLATTKFGGYIKDTFLTLAMFLPLPVWYEKCYSHDYYWLLPVNMESVHNRALAHTYSLWFQESGPFPVLVSPCTPPHCAPMAPLLVKRALITPIEVA